MRRALCLAALLAAPPAAAAEGCPVAADLGDGIRVDFADGSSEMHRRDAGSGLIEVLGTDAAGHPYRFVTAQGVYLLEAGGPGIPGGTTTYDHGRPPADLPPPEPLARWHLGATVTDFGRARFEPQIYATGPLDEIVIAGCRYDRIEVIVAYGSAATYTEGLSFLPALGIAVLVWQEWAGGDRFLLAPVAIAPAE
jgi:hypothetical protein